MNFGDMLFAIFAATIVATRAFLFLYPIPTPKIGFFRPHHWMTGLLILGIGYALNSIFLSAIGLGLFIDELPFVLMGGRSHKQNYSAASLTGVAILVVLVFLLRQEIATLI